MKTCEQILTKAGKVCGREITSDTFHGYPATNFCAHCFRRQVLSLRIQEAADELAAMLVEDGVSYAERIAMAKSKADDLRVAFGQHEGRHVAPHEFTLEWVKQKELLS